MKHIWLLCAGVQVGNQISDGWGENQNEKETPWCRRAKLPLLPCRGPGRRVSAKSPQPSWNMKFQDAEIIKRKNKEFRFTVSAWVEQNIFPTFLLNTPQENFISDVIIVA